MILNICFKKEKKMKKNNLPFLNPNVQKEESILTANVWGSK